MRSFSRAMLASSVASIAMAMAAEAQTPSAPQTVTPGATSPAQRQVQDQADQIAAQNARIDALEAQIRELTTILSHRVHRVGAQTDSGKVVATTPGPRIEGPNARNSMTFIGAAQIDVGAVH